MLLKPFILGLVAKKHLISTYSVGIKSTPAKVSMKKMGGIKVWGLCSVS